MDEDAERRRSGGRCGHRSSISRHVGQTAPPNILFELLLDVVRRHQPEIEPVLTGGAEIHCGVLAGAHGSRAVRRKGIWFQLLSIADQNAAMRRRRHIERDARARCACAARSTMFWPSACQAGIGAAGNRELLLQTMRIRPVITAHPTESKRVTVLEKYRKIYLLLRELEGAALDRTRTAGNPCQHCATRSSSSG